MSGQHATGTTYTLYTRSSSDISNTLSYCMHCRILYNANSTTASLNDKSAIYMHLISILSTLFNHSHSICTPLCTATLCTLIMCLLYSIILIWVLHNAYSLHPFTRRQKVNCFSLLSESTVYRHTLIATQHSSWSSFYRATSYTAANMQTIIYIVRLRRFELLRYLTNHSYRYKHAFLHTYIHTYLHTYRVNYSNRYTSFQNFRSEETKSQSKRPDRFKEWVEWLFVCGGPRPLPTLDARDIYSEENDQKTDDFRDLTGLSTSSIEKRLLFFIMFQRRYVLMTFRPKNFQF